MELDRRRLLQLLSAVGLVGTVSLFATGSDSRAPSDLRDFGAVGDGSADDSAALQRACDGTAGQRPIALNGGRYVVGDVLLRSDTTILGPGTLVFRPGARHLLAVNPGTGGTVDPRDNIKHIRLQGITFEGRSADGFREFEYLLWLSAVSEVTVQSCRFVYFQGDAIMIGSGEAAAVERHNDTISIVDCKFDGGNGENRNAISVIDVRGLEVRGCHFTRCSRSTMPGPIDIEPNIYDKNAVLDDIDISGNVFEKNGGNVADIALVVTPPTLRHPPVRMRITANTFVESARSAVRLSWKDHDVYPEQGVSEALVADNDMDGRGASFFCEIYGLRGVALRDNRVSGVAQAGVVCGLPGSGSAEISLSDNVWTNVGGDSQSTVLVNACRGLELLRNKIEGRAPSAFVRLLRGGYSAALTVEDNILTGVGLVAEQEPGHSTTPTLNLARSNGEAEVDPEVFAGPGGP
ncbi:glycosyl hydrolase family 28-related protein [Actinomycetospora sp. C-140]